MKNTILLVGILLITSVILFSIKSLSSKENESKNATTIGNSNPDVFLVGAYHVGCGNGNPMQELGLNVWQRFLEQETLTVVI